jgi:hypothetical protein
MVGLLASLVGDGKILARIETGAPAHSRRARLLASRKPFVFFDGAKKKGEAIRLAREGS